tara:strand:- start:8640 stop:9077 length:438 start_codon:yes stop_codon:yes gene_type:complete
MEPNTALTAVISRLNAAGLTEARSPLGVQRASSPRLNRSFSVRPQSLSPSSSPGRGKPASDGLRIEQSFNVELCHSLKPGDGQEAPSLALQDLHRAMRYLSANGSNLTTEAAILFSPATQTYDGGGAFMVTAFQLRVIYTLSLVI